MSTTTLTTRRRILDAGLAPDERLHAQRLLPLLLAQDGSTTRLCETVAGGPVELLLLHQAPTDRVPAVVREHLPGTRFLERCTALACDGEVMMDNLVYIALDGLEPALREGLEQGHAPIGHLLAPLWVRRQPLPLDAAMCERLWHFGGAPDAPASRTYRIDALDHPAMLIAETFRRGMLGPR